MSDELSRSATRVAGFDDAELDFQLLRQLGVANYGGGTVGEALAAAAEIRRRGADSWTPVFADLAERQWDDAERRARAGHPVSARDGYLRSSNSYRAAEYFAPAGSERRAELGHASEQAFMRARPDPTRRPAQFRAHIQLSPSVPGRSGRDPGSRARDGRGR
jgi:hypothetical protein